MNNANCTMVEGLRSLVGGNGWDYCVLWKLSQDQRYLEWMGCCCSGGEVFSAEKSECRDMFVQHQRTRACDALSLLPSSIPLDSSLGIYAQVLISNQPAWLTKISDSTSPLEVVGGKTRVLIPIPGGLVELFVTKPVSENIQVVNFVMSQYGEIPMSDIIGNIEDDDYSWKNNFQYVPGQVEENNVNYNTWDPLADAAQMYGGSPLNLLDGGAVTYQNGIGGESSVQENNVREGVKKEGGMVRGESEEEGSEEEEEGRTTVGRNGKRQHCKNLVAERKRRKKLNDRLYTLRSLVPKITKMDRASILGDAIEYVMELQKQVKELQDELEDDTNPEEDETKHIGSNNCKTEGPTVKGVGMELDESPNSSRMKQTVPEHVNNDDKGNHEMEPQVEVRQVEGNEFYLKVLCEHKMGGFARLMEAMSSLGLEVTNANVTTHRTLVLNVFRVEKRENELLQVDQVRDSLLEITRGPVSGWSDASPFTINGGDYQHNGRNHHQQQQHLLSSQSQLHYLNHHI